MRVSSSECVVVMIDRCSLLCCVCFFSAFQLADLSAIGLSATQVEQFTQRNLMSSMWTNANAITATGSSNMED